MMIEQNGADMKFREKLKNPFLLAGQGFALGAVLFFATQSQTGEAHAGATPQPSILDRITAAR